MRPTGFCHFASHASHAVSSGKASSALKLWSPLSRFPTSATAAAAAAKATAAAVMATPRSCCHRRGASAMLLRKPTSSPHPVFSASARRCNSYSSSSSQAARRAAAFSTSSPSSAASSRRRSVTPLNDDGQVPWADLSGAEKTGRAAQQTFNFGMVVVGLVLTGGVGYFLYTDVFSPSSKVSHFNRAVDRIRADPRCIEALGADKGTQITAFGQETTNKWRRARPIASTSRTDANGNEHLLMHFNVRGPRAEGVAHIHMVRRGGSADAAFVYRYFYVEVPGHDRIYLERDATDELRGGGSAGSKKTTLFGIKWS